MFFERSTSTFVSLQAVESSLQLISYQGCIIIITDENLLSANQMAEPSGALQGHFVRSRSISSRITSGPRDQVEMEEESLHPLVKEDQAGRPLPPKRLSILEGLKLPKLIPCIVP